jgi:hypothetical protein
MCTRLARLASVMAGRIGWLEAQVPPEALPALELTEKPSSRPASNGTPETVHESSSSRSGRF